MLKATRETDFGGRAVGGELRARDGSGQRNRRCGGRQANWNGQPAGADGGPAQGGSDRRHDAENTGMQNPGKQTCQETGTAKDSASPGAMRDESAKEQKKQ